MSATVNFQFPDISLVNSEIKDPLFYFSDDELNTELPVSFNVHLESVTASFVSFFLHIALFKEDVEKDKNIRLLHFDFQIILQYVEEIDNSIEQIEVKKLELAHLLGAGIIMTRGALKILLNNHYFSQFQPPIISPLEILKDQLSSSDDLFVLTLENEK